MSALTLYLVCLAFGGLLLAASALGGGHGDHDHAVDHGHDQGHDGHHLSAFSWLLNLRFWTFSLAFFGLTGPVLTAAGALPAAATLALAAVIGLGAGYVASRILQTLGRPLGVVAAAGAHIGREGVLLLPVDRAQPGKVRLSIAGASTDFVAETQAEEALPIGTTVLVVGFRGNVALVERTPGTPMDKELS